MLSPDIKSRRKWQLFSFAHIFFGLVLVVLTVFLFRPLLLDVYYESDDYNHHVARLANYYLALKQGQFPPRWAPNLNSGLGYPVFNYIYPLPYAMGVLFYITGRTLQESTNLLVLTALLIAVISATNLARVYKLPRSISAIIGMVSIINPYILLIVYWRGAIGELYAYSLGLTLLWLLETTKSTARQSLAQTGVALSVAGLLLSHLPIGTTILVMLLLHHWLTASKFHALRAFYSFIQGLLISSWYWIPAILEKGLISYNQSGWLMQHSNQFIQIGNLFDFRRSLHSSSIFLEVLQIGIFPMLVLVSGMLYWLKKPRDYSVGLWIAWILISIGLMQPFTAALWDSFAPLQYLQFPWRLLVIICIGSVALTPKLLSRSNTLTIKLLAGILVFSAIFAYAAYGYPKKANYRSDYEWLEWSGVASSFDEHKPKTLTSIPDLAKETLFVKKLSANLDDQEEVEINYIHKSGSHLNYFAHINESGFLVHKRAVFPGWIAKVNNEVTQIYESTQAFQGLIILPVSAGNKVVSIRFNGITRVRLISQILALFGLLSLVDYNNRVMARGRAWLYSLFIHRKK